jgi:hypothetical protein
MIPELSVHALLLWLGGETLELSAEVSRMLMRCMAPLTWQSMLSATACQEDATKVTMRTSAEPFVMALLQAEEAAVSQIRSEEHHHCMQVLHDAKAGVAVPRGEPFCAQ